VSASPEPSPDVVVVGGGIAGASCAHHLAVAGVSVALVERETELGTHSSGRSAATLIPGYGGVSNDDLTSVGLAFLASGGDGLAEHPLIASRVVLSLFPRRPERDLVPLIGAQQLTAAEAAEVCPVLVPSSITGAEMHRDGYDIDVEELLRTYVRGARRHGASIHRSAEAVELRRDAHGWTVTTPEARMRCRVVVDAANAWADEVAARAGLTPIGFVPMRRTAFIAPSAGADQALPHTRSADNSFYFKPDVPGHLLCSRADETPTVPGDPRPEELDVAAALERINAHTTLGIRSVRRAWAGLRVFAPDRRPRIEPHGNDESFIWCAGLGGTGVQTSVGVGLRVRELVLDRLR
jgi:D-arginine dehydrogenase